MQAANIKEEVHKLADQLSEDATWDDVAYTIYVRQKVAEGLEDIDAARTISHEALRKKWELKLENKVD